MIVAFWSPFAGSSTSSTLLATAIVTAASCRTRCSVMSLGYDTESIFPYFMPNESSELHLFENTGIDALFRTSKNKVATVQEVEDCSFSFLENKLNVFTQSNVATEVLYYDNLKSAVANVFEGLRNTYAVSFVDTASEVNKYSKEVLNLADLVVICLPQTQYKIDKFFKDYDFKGSNVMYVIGNYDDRQKTKAFKIMMQYTVGKKCGQVLTLPNNPEYADSMNNREAIRYFLRNIECTQKDPNYHFIQSSTKIAKDILKRCKISSTVGGE